MGYMDDLLVLDKEYKRGDKGKKVKLIQEWLCIHKTSTPIDGDFGPATEEAVKKFQEKERLGATGIVNNETFERLIKPMKNVLKPIEPNGRTLGEMVVPMQNSIWNNIQ
ncbi:MAG: peptidoglycan-binding protein [Deltaproteobacteria bacterium]|uniref:Peptidoglycan-binding protein n=1 Tax=Candidatus Zymogenus saltonus TaxID=2844893 RepID=A0A9D8KFH7_9DELT|nr:peptidoglycan-binding protein [Candidatus Zymogenus saltonus]